MHRFRIGHPAQRGIEVMRGHWWVCRSPAAREYRPQRTIATVHSVEPGMQHPPRRIAEYARSCVRTHSWRNEPRSYYGRDRVVLATKCGLRMAIHHNLLDALACILVTMNDEEQITLLDRALEHGDFLVRCG